MFTITIKDIRKIFFTKDGFPRKECLKDVLDIGNLLNFNFNSMSKIERSYWLNRINTSIGHFRKLCREHHINFLDVKVKGCKYIKHGFSQDKNHIENSSERIRNRMIVIKSIYKEVKKLQSEQLLLFDNNRR